MSGQVECVNGEFRSCALDGQGCLAWSGPSTCPNGFCESVLACGECDNVCAVAGEKVCSDTKIAECIVDEFGCLALDTPKNCPTGSACQNGRCTLDNCHDECAPLGTKGCLGEFEVECALDDDNCFKWSGPQVCPAQQTCRDGSCKATCANACVLDETRCQDGGVQTCLTDANDCTVWSMSTPCDVGEVCAEGSCTAIPDAFVVDQSTDAPDLNPGDGICDSGLLPACSLRAAIEEANALYGARALTFSGQHRLALGPLVINSDISLLALSGAEPAVIDGRGQHQVFVVEKGASADFESFTVKNGLAESGIHGAGLLVRGEDTSLKLREIIVSGNRITGGGAGAGIRVEHGAALHARNCTIKDNRSDGLGVGISLAVSGTVVIETSTISGNTVTTRDGQSGIGMHVHEAASVAIDRSAIVSNGDHNAAMSDGGGLMITGARSNVIVSNTTIAFNIARWGTGLALRGGSVTVESCTIARNRGLASDSRGVYFYDGTGGFRNTIVSHNFSLDQVERNCQDAGKILSLGGNIAQTMEDEDGYDCDFLSGIAGDVIADPMLADRLSSVEGPTPTLPISADSPARDLGISGCPEIDQRGVMRGDTCDSGAFEVVP